MPGGQISIWPSNLETKQGNFIMISKQISQGAPYQYVGIHDSYVTTILSTFLEGWEEGAIKPHWGAAT